MASADLDGSGGEEQMFNCGQCQMAFGRSDLEAHIAADHLNYFPYGCAQCHHWMASEELAHFHAHRKQHLPIKILENVVMTKEKRLEDLINTSVQLAGRGGAVAAAVDAQTSQQDSKVHSLKKALSSALAPAAAAAGPSTYDRSSSSSPPSSASALARAAAVAAAVPPPVAVAAPAVGSPANSEELHAPTVDEARAVAAVAIATPEMIGLRRKLSRDDADPDSSSTTHSKRPRLVVTEATPTTPQAEEAPTTKCRQCGEAVATNKRLAHARRHQNSSVAAVCSYCPYEGRTPNSVRVHITWRHKGCSTKTGVGVALKGTAETEMESVERCFGGGGDAAAPLAVGAALQTPRPYARRAAKSVNPTTKQSNDATPLPVSSTPPAQQAAVAAATGIDGEQERLSATVRRVSTNARGRTYRHLICQQCGHECLDALASGHVYTAHVRRHDAVQCGYCDFGTTYAMSDVKRHLATKHPGEPPKLIDRRQQLQDVYLHWRSLCFPDVGARQRGAGETVTPPPQDDDDDDGLLTSPSADLLTRAAVGAVSVVSACGRNNAKRRCAICSAQVTQQWMNRHVWQHLSEDDAEHAFVCAVGGCGFGTALRRSLDTHYDSRHGSVGPSADLLGGGDRRPHLGAQFQARMRTCFGESVAAGWDADDGAEPIDDSDLGVVEGDAWCRLCDDIVPSDKMREHTWAVHMADERRYRCSSCDEAFDDLQLAIDHCATRHALGEDKSDRTTPTAKVVEDSEVRGRYEMSFATCFPATRPSPPLKTEPLDDIQESSAFELA